MCNSAPSAPQLPAYPDLTPEQQQILSQLQGSNAQMGNVVQGVSGQLQGNQQLLQGASGLFNPDGTINQDALAALQSQTGKSVSTAGGAGNTALDYLNTLYGTGGALGATQNAYTNALAGNVPANKQLEFTQQQNFQQVKEAAAQRGIRIDGDNWQTATSNSTAGQKMIQNYQQNANIQNQNYQLGYVNQLAGNMGQLSGVGAQTANTGLGLAGYATQTPLGLGQQSITSGMGALTPYLQSYQTGLSNLYQPYYMQQIGPYQQQMAQAQANYQADMQQYQANQGMLGGIGSLAGMGIGAFLGGPMGAMAGSQLGGMLGGGSGTSSSMGMLPYMYYMSNINAGGGGKTPPVPSGSQNAIAGAGA